MPVRSEGWNWQVVVNGKTVAVYPTKRQANAKADKINHQSRNMLVATVEATANPVTKEA